MRNFGKTRPAPWAGRQFAKSPRTHNDERPATQRQSRQCQAQQWTGPENATQVELGFRNPARQSDEVRPGRVTRDCPGELPDLFIRAGLQPQRRGKPMPPRIQAGGGFARFGARRILLAKFPEALAQSRLVASPNSKLFMAAVRRANQRKNASMDDLVHILQKGGWDPNAPDLVEAPVKSRSRSPKDGRADVLERYERRARSRRKFAIREFDAAKLAARPSETQNENG